jgi:hypothetical protein
MIRTAISPKPKLHKCRACGEKFSKSRSIQPTCGKFECLVAYGEKVAAKSAAKRVSEAKRVAAAETKARKEAVKTIPQLKAEVEKVCHEYIRYRDRDKPCICCGKWAKENSPLTGGQWDAAHYRSRGSADHLRYDERNIHRALKDCNTYGHTNYRAGLIERIGLAEVEALEADQTIVKWTRELLLEKKAYFRAKLKELKAGEGLQ